MHLPKIYENFQADFPQVFEHYKQLGVTTRQAGPLDEKTQDLVKMGIAIGSNSRGAIMSHTRKAIAAGATSEEINHAVLLAMTTTGSLLRPSIHHSPQQSYPTAPWARAPPRCCWICCRTKSAKQPGRSASADRLSLAVRSSPRGRLLEPTS